MFSTHPKKNSFFFQLFILLSANAFNLKTCRFGKGLANYIGVMLCERGRNAPATNIDLDQPASYLQTNLVCYIPFVYSFALPWTFMAPNSDSSETKWVMNSELCYHLFCQRYNKQDLFTRA